MVGPSSTSSGKPARQNLNSLLDEIRDLAAAEQDTPDGVTFRELMAAVGRRSYGPLLLVIGLFSISPATAVPGMTWLSAALTLFVALQMAVGMRRPWLPGGLLNREISAPLLTKGVNGFRPWAKRIDAFLKPRLTFLAQAPFVNFIALLCVAAALITIPLGFIPFAPLAPGLVIVMFGLGMTARDGLLLLLGVVGIAATAAIAWPLIGRVIAHAQQLLQ